MFQSGRNMSKNTNNGHVGNPSNKINTLRGHLGTTFKIMLWDVDRMPGLKSQLHFQFQLPANSHLWKQQMMAVVLGETHNVFPPSGVCLARLQLRQTCEE